MKRFFYILLFTVCSAVAVTSCTEEEVKPTQEADTTNGTANTGKL
jgi:hypothetical protein